MENIRAKDVLIPIDQYPHIPYWFTLRQAMMLIETSELERDGRKSLPRVVLVFDEKYQLMGMVRRRDILRGLEPDFLSQKPISYRRKLFDVKVDPNLSEISFDKIIFGVRERAERPVSEVMIPIEATVDYEDHIVKVIYEMNQHDLSILPVLKDNKVVGVVRTVDVFHEIAKSVL
jgi:CBS-domain-containing membrane protein